MSSLPIVVRDALWVDGRGIPSPRPTVSIPMWVRDALWEFSGSASRLSARAVSIPIVVRDALRESDDGPECTGICQIVSIPIVVRDALRGSATGRPTRPVAVCLNPDRGPGCSRVPAPEPVVVLVVVVSIPIVVRDALRGGEGGTPQAPWGSRVSIPIVVRDALRVAALAEPASGCRRSVHLIVVRDALRGARGISPRTPLLQFVAIVVRDARGWSRRTWGTRERWSVSIPSWSWGCSAGKHTRHSGIIHDLCLNPDRGPGCSAGGGMGGPPPRWGMSLI